MTVDKSPMRSSVLVKFSNIRYKRFLFAARKRLRDSEDPVCQQLFINDYLTSHNYQLLVSLKKERAKRANDGTTSFSSVYSFDGKIFVKKIRNVPNSEAIHVKSFGDMVAFLSSLDSTNENGN